MATLISCLEDEFPASVLEAVMQLTRMELARIHIGWRGARWWYLTKRGEMVQDRGKA